jgi:hypothetical protein
MAPLLMGAAGLLMSGRSVANPSYCVRRHSHEPESFPSIPKGQLEWFRNSFRPHFDKWVIGPIDRLVNKDDALVGFIMMTCAIDWLASFWWGKSTEKKNRAAYTGFVSEYFRPIGRYDPVALYKSLRNGLVHLFTIQNQKYALTHNNPSFHLIKTSDGHVVLNASNFRDDLVAAKDRYFSDVEAKPDLLKKLVDRYTREGFLTSGPLVFP